MSNSEHPMSNIHQLLSTRFAGYSAFVIRYWLFIFTAMSNSEHPAPNNKKAPLLRGFDTPVGILPKECPWQNPKPSDFILGYSLFSIRYWLFVFAAMSNSKHPAPNNEKAPLSRGFDTPVGIRTPNLLIRSQMLYPVELRVHF
jgi:hypothetical protein